MENEKSIPTPEEFYLETSIYSSFKILENNWRLLLDIETYQESIDCFCPSCNNTSTFKFIKSEVEKDLDKMFHYTLIQGNTPGVSSENNKIRNDAERKRQENLRFTMYESRNRHHKKRLVCSRNDNHKIIYDILIDNKCFIKFGQYPSQNKLQEQQFEKYSKIISEEQIFELGKATEAYSYGLGIGSIIYLRRVLEALIKKAVGTAIEQDNIDNKEVQKAQRSIFKKIKLAKNHSPKLIVEKPIIANLLNIGVHKLKEKDCLDHFILLKQTIIAILDQEYDRIVKIERDKELGKEIENLNRIIHKSTV